MIATKFQRLYHVLEVRNHGRTSGYTVRCVCRKPKMAAISAEKQLGLFSMAWCVVHQRWRSLTKESSRNQRYYPSNGRAVFFTLTAGGVQKLQDNKKLHPPVSPERIGIFRGGFHQSVRNHKKIISDDSGTIKCQATLSKLQMAAVRPDVIMMS